MNNHTLLLILAVLAFVGIGAASPKEGGPYQLSIIQLRGRPIGWVIDQSNGDLFVVENPDVIPGVECGGRYIGNVRFMEQVAIQSGLEQFGKPMKIVPRRYP